MAKKIKIFQITNIKVPMCSTYKSVHGDVFIRPTVKKGSKVKEGQILEIFQSMSCLYSNWSWWNKESIAVTEILTGPFSKELEVKRSNFSNIVQTMSYLYSRIEAKEGSKVKKITIKFVLPHFKRFIHACQRSNSVHESQRSNAVW